MPLERSGPRSAARPRTSVRCRPCSPQTSSARSATTARSRSRLGCGYYLGSPHLPRISMRRRGCDAGSRRSRSRHSGARAVIAPHAAVTPRLLEDDPSGRLRPESFAVTSPKRFAALVRAQRSKTFSTMRLRAFRKPFCEGQPPRRASRIPWPCRGCWPPQSAPRASRPFPSSRRRPCGSCLWPRLDCVRWPQWRTQTKSRPAPSRTTSRRPTPSSPRSIGRRMSFRNWSRPSTRSTIPRANWT